MRSALLLFFYLLLCCQTAESLTNKRVILGQNVTLDCNVDGKEIYWLFIKPPGSLVVLFRTFNTESTSPIFHDQTLKNKYSSLTFSRLFIHNITVNELGTYYCVKLEGSGLQVSNGTRLYINETQNGAEQTDQEQHMQLNTTKTHSALTLTSISLNVLLFIIIIVLLMQRCRKPRKSPKPHENVKAEQNLTDDVNIAEYSEIELPSYSRRPQPNNNLINGIYTLLEKPKADATQAQT